MFTFFLTFVAVGQVLVGVAANADAIPIGSSLHVNSRGGHPTSWLSPSGRFAFGFYPEGLGFSIGINMSVSLAAEPIVIWTGRTAAGDEVFKEPILFFTEQGFLLTPYNEAKNITLIQFNGTKSTIAAMLDNGNFVVYDSNPSNLSINCSTISVQDGSGVKDGSCIIWQSFDNPTDTMMGGQVLPCGSNLISRENTTDHSFFQLSMQCDSNLVIYATKKTRTADGNTTTESNAIWASLTYRRGFDKLILSDDGRLFLRSPDGTREYNLSPPNPYDILLKTLYYATQAPNKYFQLFALNIVTNKFNMVYEIPTFNNDCEREHQCGMNSYCILINNRAECRCLPGFNFADSRIPAKGCQRNITEPNCWPPGSSDTTAFSMEPVESLVWYDEPYSIVSAESKEDCSGTCLSECDCEAALFFNKNCAKHKLPMSRAIIGSNLTNDASTAYIKISAEDSGGDGEANQWLKRHLMAVLLCGAIDAGVFLALLVVGAGSYWLFYGRYRLLWRKWGLAFQEEVAPRSISFQELARATNSFATELGRGGHATVFKGYLTMYGRHNPEPVAVKRLRAEEGKGENDFHAEIRIIGRAHHVNLVRLLGFCYEESNHLLIYEYMSRGSLADLISKSPPNWKQQAELLLGVARGLNYLHRECESKIIHRDIKPENILIAENWIVKISDFGISKLSVGGLLATSTKRTSAPGTPGYVAPECVQSKGENVTEKADVYSFGVVVLETVFWERNTQDNNLLEFAAKYCKDLKVELTDEEWKKRRMVRLGMSCVQENPDARPYMEDVILSMQEGAMPVPIAAAVVTPQIITSRKKISWAPR